MKINCLSCGFSIELDDSYSDYKGEVRCYTCKALLEVRADDDHVKSVKQVHFPVGLQSGRKMADRI